MFGVVRDWARGKEARVFGTFVLRFRQNFWQSLAVGVLWAVLGATLYLDFLLVGGLPGGARAIARSLLVLATVLYALASVFLFPVMVHYETRWAAVPKNALLLAVGRLPVSLLCLMTVVAAAALTLFVPVLALISGSVTAHAVYRLCDRAFRRVDANTDG